MVIKSSSRVQAKSASSKATFMPPGEAYGPKETTAGVAAGLDTASPSKAKTTGASAATQPDSSYMLRLAECQVHLGVHVVYR